jgi:two-component system chemotaxis response regulator CheY
MARVLIVEDSAAMRGFIASTVSQLAGVEVIESPSGFDALKSLPRQSVDLIVMDINMPDINGLELLSFVRKNARTRTTPVVIVTTEAGAEDRRRALELGADAYVCKPFAPEDLLATVRGLLEKAR